MTFINWFWSLGEWSLWAPALTTSTIVGVLGFILGTRYKASIEKGIQSRFDQKLELLRSQLRSDEERAKAALKQQDAEIEALRSGALAGLAARRTTLDKRRLEAVEKIWKSVISHGPHRLVSGFAKILKMDYVLKECERDSEFRKIPDSILKMAGFDDPKNFPKVETADDERPFVSPLLWALLSAYKSIVSFPTVQFVTAKGGISPDALKADDVLKLATVALPEHENYINQYKERSLPYLVEPLEQKILEEIQKFIEMSNSGKESIDQAAEILKAASAAAQAQQLARTSIPAAAVAQ